jgi:D-arabinose 1-dehydrogenase-like Zn-dependent alcohol dehydrogenase
MARRGCRSDVDFTVGASLPMPGLTAWQGLFEHGRLRAGQSVIAHGAAGVVGSMVTQLAREAGAYVSAPDAPPIVGRCSTSARRSSSISRTTSSKTSAELIWFSTSSAATSGSGQRV